MSKQTALIVIDMQKDFVLPGAPACIAGAMATVPNIARLLEWFRERQLPVFHVVREYRADGSDIEITRLDSFLAGKRCVVLGTEGCDIVDELKPVEGEYRVVKNRYSAFLNTELDFMLRRLDVRNLVICGTQYPNCVRATVFDAVSHGYGVTVVTDATSAQTRGIADANILDIRNIGVECIETQELIAERVRQYKKQGREVMELTEKVRELVAVGASITANCQPCLQYHADKARKEGATPQEIEAAIGVGRQVRKGASAKMDEFSSGLKETICAPAGAKSSTCCS